MAISDHIAVMDEGRIEQVGAPRELYDKPANGFVMSFLGPVSEVGGRPGAAARHRDPARARRRHAPGHGRARRAPRLRGPRGAAARRRRARLGAAQSRARPTRSGSRRARSSGSARPTGRSSPPDDAAAAGAWLRPGRRPPRAGQALRSRRRPASSSARRSRRRRARRSTPRWRARARAAARPERAPHRQPQRARAEQPARQPHADAGPVGARRVLRHVAARGADDDRAAARERARERPVAAVGDHEVAPRASSASRTATARARRWREPANGPGSRPL